MVINMVKRITGIILINLTILPLCFSIKAQQVKLWVVFKDKPKNNFDASVYFTQKNLERKKTQSLPLYDNYDLPINQNYINELNSYCDSITFVSRWMNAACVYCSFQKVDEIKQLSFVNYIEEINSQALITEYKESINDLHRGEINLLKGQMQRMQAGEFKKNKLTGKGVTVAIIDAGFSGYLKNDVLKKLRDNNQIKHTYDFVRKNNNVDCGATHGTAVLSCIGGQIDSVLFGCAFESDFLLYRTEKAFNEKFSEEEYWMAAMEEADRQGADIINTSLGYNERRYFRKDMDGRKSLLSKAANIASRKGMLVVCSAGNEGDVDWKVICTPADADSALTVGAINPWTGIQASWSSYGPSADKRIKPNVCAYGYVMAAQGSKGIYETMGTSFSCPLIAGFAACTRQLNPTITAYQLLHKIEKSADLFPYYDYAHGYGVPQAKNILSNKSDSIHPTFEIIINGDSLRILLKDNNPSQYLLISDYHLSYEDTSYLYTDVHGEKVRKSTHFKDGIYSGTSLSSLNTNEPGYFYYNIQQKDELYLHEYAVLNVRSRIIFRTTKTSEPKTYSFYYKGYSRSITF
jgi:serine protease AprX